jgi:predicted AAA+ superfamily ATPase
MTSRESGAGRFTEFILPPLTFAEYLRFAGQDEALITDADRLNLFLGVAARLGTTGGATMDKDHAAVE